MSRILILAVNFYQYFLSTIISILFGKGCRFQPTCSEYALEAINNHGVFRGTVISIKRILRCHPWGRSGYDPVP